MDDWTTWRTYAPAGLLLVGAGLSTALDASGRRTGGAPTRHWVTEGTVGLLLVNAGLSLFGEAVKRRALFDARRSPTQASDKASDRASDKAPVGDPAGSSGPSGPDPQRPQNPHDRDHTLRSVSAAAGRSDPAVRRPSWGVHSSW